MALHRLQDRAEAGHELARRLIAFRKRPDTIVLGLPRGGLAVARPLAQELALPLDALVVGKLTMPAYPELAVGAVAAQGTVVWNQDLIDALQAPRPALEVILRRAQAEVKEWETLLRPGQAELDLKAKTVILTDDGLATGATMRAAIQASRALGASRVIIALGVAAPSSLAWLNREADQVVALIAPDPFSAVGVWYQSFAPVSTQEALLCLSGAPPAPD
jgi:putative phosphoribosyl transferase